MQHWPNWYNFHKYKNRKTAVTAVFFYNRFKVSGIIRPEINRNHFFSLLSESHSQNPLKTILSLISFLLITSFTYGQLGFCNGSKGAPIFFENFGSGTNFGPPLPAGVTSYSYTTGVPDDGDYTLSYRTNFYQSWHSTTDHTPDNQPDGTNGKSLIVNASFSTGEFYKRTVSGLCVNTTFEFSAWVLNLSNAASDACNSNSIPIDVTFEIWDASETTLLKSGGTDPIQASANINWQQFGLTFTTLPGQTAVVLKMKNNGAGGCGNDLAIDDIMFRSCGDVTTISSPLASGTTYTACSDITPVNNANLSIIINSNPHVFQWQQSADNVTWADIAGETSLAYNPTNITTTTYFRVKVAQDIANLANAFCFTLSDIFSIIVIPKPVAPTNNGDKTICSNDPIPALSVTAAAGNSVDWFDAAVGGNIVQANSDSFLPTIAGSYYAEAYVGTNCKSNTRTKVTLTINPQPVTTDAETFVCESKTTDLDAGFNDADFDFLWSTTEVSRIISVGAAGTYTVIITSNAGCSVTKTFTVSEKKIPVITTVDTTNETVTISISQTGDYEYSVDGIYYQDSNIFPNVEGGQHTAYVREKNTCGEDFQDFVLVRVPKYFTPNNDGFNDFFEISGLSFMPNATVYIFDQFGKLLKTTTSANPTWNGMFNGKPLPASDYWYKIIFENGTALTGHFSLKR